MMLWRSRTRDLGALGMSCSKHPGPAKGVWITECKLEVERNTSSRTVPWRGGRRRRPGRAPETSRSAWLRRSPSRTPRTRRPGLPVPASRARGGQKSDPATSGPRRKPFFYHPCPRPEQVNQSNREKRNRRNALMWWGWGPGRRDP